MALLYNTATEYLSNALTFTRGGPEDVTSVGVFHSTDPTHVPEENEFTTVPMIEPPNPLSQSATADVLSLIGPDPIADLELAPGMWQRWVLVKTATETIIRKVDVLEIV